MTDGATCVVTSDVAALLDDELGDQVSKAPAVLAALLARLEAQPQNSSVVAEQPATGATDDLDAARSSLLDAIVQIERKNATVDGRVASLDTCVGGMAAHAIVEERTKLRTLTAAKAYLTWAQRIETLNDEMAEADTGSPTQLKLYSELVNASKALQATNCTELHRLCDRRAREWSRVLVADHVRELQSVLGGVAKLYTGAEDGGPARLGPEASDAFRQQGTSLAQLEPPSGPTPTMPNIIRAILEPLVTRFKYHHRPGKEGVRDHRREYRQIRASVMKWIRSHGDVLELAQEFLPPEVGARKCFAAGLLALVAGRAVHDLDQLRSDKPNASTAVGACDIVRACLEVDAAIVTETGPIAPGGGCWASIAADPARVSWWLQFEDLLLHCRLREVVTADNAWEWHPLSAIVGGIDSVRAPSCGTAILALGNGVRELCGLLASNSARLSLTKSQVALLLVVPLVLLTQRNPRFIDTSQTFRELLAARVEQTLWNLSGENQLRKLVGIVNATWYIGRSIAVMAEEPEFFPLGGDSTGSSTDETDIEAELTQEAARYDDLKQQFVGRIERFTVDPFRRSYLEYLKSISRVDEPTPALSLHPIMASGLKTLSSSFGPLREFLAPELFTELVGSIADDVGDLMLVELLSGGSSLSEKSANQLRFDTERGLLQMFQTIVTDSERRLTGMLEACMLVTLSSSDWVLASQTDDESAFRSLLVEKCKRGIQLDSATARKLLDLRLDLKFTHSGT